MLVRYTRAIALALFVQVMPGLAQPKGRDIILNFITANPDRCAVVLFRNDSLIASVNEGKVIPLASTVKIMIAIEYAAQAAAGTIDPGQPVAVSELEKFYVRDTDGGAHPAWLHHVSGKITNGAVPLREVAKGMLTFSSNANSEWLLYKLGPENVNARIRQLGLDTHTPVFYFVSAMFIGTEVFADLPEKERLKKLSEMPADEYAAHAARIHKKLLADTVYKKRLKQLSVDEQRVFTARFPSAALKDYAALMRKINGKKWFDGATQKQLDSVLEFLMDNPRNRSWLRHAGMKGGSTLFVVTKALYATDTAGNRTELCYGFYPIGWPENEVLPRATNDFEIAVLKEAEFRDKLKPTASR